MEAGRSQRAEKIGLQPKNGDGDRRRKRNKNEGSERRQQQRKGDQSQRKGSQQESLIKSDKIGSGGLKTLYLNAQSILSKLPDLEATAFDSKPDLILITESWCNANIEDNILNITGFELIKDLRSDRTDTTNGIGGGLLVYARKGLVILSIDKVNDFNQYVHFRVKTSICDLNVFLIYRPPSSSVLNYNMLCDVIKTAPKDSLIIGDINLPNINWKNLTSDNFSRDFMNSCIDNNFVQYIDFPTHRKNNILDLVLSNNDCVINVENLGPLSNSDHVMLLIHSCVDFLVNDSNEIKLAWSKANYDEMKNNLTEKNWSNVLSSDNIESNWQSFKSVINDVIKRHVPISNKSDNNSKPIWMNSHITRLKRRKTVLYKRMKLTNSENDIKNYKTAEKELRKATRRAKRKIEVKISKKSGNDGKNCFNRYIKSKLSNHTGIGPLIDENGQVTGDSKKMADILNNQFSSVFTPDTDIHQDIPNMNVEEELNRIVITDEEIRNKIDSLKFGKAPGPDGISSSILKNLKEQLVEPLRILFQQSIDQECVPEDWKQAKVVPLFKKGAKGVAANYRPVSLTSTVCKLLESIIRDAITDHLIRYNLLRDSQHGFTANRSCQTNLIEFMDLITSIIDDGDPVDVVYLDFSKAFDKISHSKLCSKLKAHGVNGKVLNWIKDWLTNRKQWVTVNGFLSDEANVISGVPQGSVLGPILFIIYINDIDEAVTNLIDMLRKFADDTKMAKRIKSDNDTVLLQKCLDNLFEWSSKWSMEFNTKKCKVMHFGRNNPQHQYNINGDLLESVNKEKDIGVKITSNLKPSEHCQEAAGRARAVLGQISRCFHYRDKHVFLKLFKQYVRPHLEFSSAVWSPWLIGDINILEQVQIKALRMISGLQTRDYLGQLKELNLWSLQKRRIMLDLLQAYKIVHGIGNIKCNMKLVGQRTQNFRTTRSQADEFNLTKERCRLDCRKHFFTNRIVELWNSLPSEIKHITPVKKFKSKLIIWMNERKLTDMD